MRAKIIWTVLALVVAVVAWALMTPPAAPGRVGVNQLVENAVTTTPAGRSDWQPSITGADVNFGDRVATAAASRLEISLLDRSLLTVGANAQLDIDRFVYDPERSVAGVAVSVLRGAFRFASDNHGAQPEAIAFRTPGSAIGIRGTIIEGVVGPEAVALLAGIPGAPDLSAEADSAAVIILRSGAIGVAVNGQSVVLDRPVQMVALTRTRLYPPFGVSDETTRRFEALLPTRPGPVSSPPEALPEAGSQVRPPVIVPPPTVRDPPVRDPVVRPPLNRGPPAVVTAPPSKPAPGAASPPPRDPPARPPLTREPAPVVAAPPLRSAVEPAPPPRDPPVRVTPAPEPAPSAAAPPTRAPPIRAVPVEPRTRAPVRPPPQPPRRVSPTPAPTPAPRQQ